MAASHAKCIPLCGCAAAGIPREKLVQVHGCWCVRIVAALRFSLSGLQSLPVCRDTASFCVKCKAKDTHEYFAGEPPLALPLPASRTDSDAFPLAFYV